MIDDKLKNTDVPEQDITDIKLAYVEKKKFRINGDNTKILELNVSDLNTYKRLSETYPKLQTLLQESRKAVESIDVETDDIKALDAVSNILTDIDRQMRELVDYTFDTNASEVCAPSGNMFDPVGGQYRFERVLDTISQLYTTGLSTEFEKLKDRVNKKTSKYTKKYHK